MKIDFELKEAANALMDIVGDSARNLISAGGSARDFRLYAYFERYGLERQQLANEFRRLVAHYGGVPHGHDGAFRSFRRLMAKVQAAMPHGERAMIEAFVRNEEVLIARIDDILRRANADPSLSDLVGKLRGNLAAAARDLGWLSGKLHFA